MHSGSGSLALKQNSAVSVYVGIASLVLEGRVVSADEDDDDAFSSMKFESNQSIQSGNVDSSKGVSSSARYGVIHRISEKLMRLRQFPGSNKEIVETSVAIPTLSRDDCEYERMNPRLHHVASSREFQRNPRLTNVPSSSASNSSSAASVLHDIDVDWNDISILFNGLDSLINLPGSPIKIPLNVPFMSSIPMHQSSMLNDSSMKMFKIKDKAAGKQNARPKQGPHCEKFLKKIGILKADPIELESGHICNHVSGYVSFANLFLKCSYKFSSFLVSPLAISLENAVANPLKGRRRLHRSVLGTRKQCNSVGTMDV